MSLDGVVQAPAYTDEDTSGGFKHGGWHLRYFEERSMKWVVENVSGAGGFLLGRRTYEVFAAALAEGVPGRAGVRPAAEQPPKVRRVENAAGAARLAEFEVTRQPDRRVRGQAATRRRRESARDRQHRARGRTPGAAISSTSSV